MKTKISLSDQTTLHCFLNSNHYPAKLEQIREAIEKSMQSSDSVEVRTAFGKLLIDLERAMKKVEKLEKIYNETVA